MCKIAKKEHVQLQLSYSTWHKKKKKLRYVLVSFISRITLQFKVKTAIL